MKHAQFARSRSTPRGHSRRVSWAHALCASALAFAALVTSTACEESIPLERKLSSFEITLFSGTGSPERRCILAGTPTTGVDLSGCPEYVRDASDKTVVVVPFEARALDNQGELLETYDNLASVRVEPGQVDSAFARVRFSGGVTGTGDARPTVAFRGAFGDTFLWLTDDQAPSRASDAPGLGATCRSSGSEVCAPAGLVCVNSTPAVGYDPDGLAYCTRGCDADADCPTGYACSRKFVAYEDAAMRLQDGACLRVQPSYAVGAGGPLHFRTPTISDLNRSDSFISSPFEGSFIEVTQGELVVTAIRIDGFYLSDVSDTEFNHLFVFNFNRPDDLFPGDKLVSVAGPITEFNGLTELNFPFWEVDYAAGSQPIPTAVDLHGRVRDVYPNLVAPGGDCVFQRIPPDVITLLDCAPALERLEAARVSVRAKRLIPIVAGSREDETYGRFGQWPVVVDTGSRELQVEIITRDNIPFFDPRALADDAELGVISGNLRQVAFDDRDEPIWIVEPREQSDCPACKNR